MLKNIFFSFHIFVLFITVYFQLKLKGFEQVVTTNKSKKKVIVRNMCLKKNIILIEIVSKFLPFCTCLVKSVVLMRMSNHLPTLKLIIGVSKTPDFRSHAWVEYDDKIIFGEVVDQRKFSKIWTSP